MKKLIFFIQLLLVLFFVSTVKAAECPVAGQCYCRFYPDGQAGAVAGNVTISSSCAVYGDLDGVNSGNLTISPGATITLHKKLVFSQGNSINVQNGGIIYINTGGQIVQGGICVKDADADGYAETTTLDKDPYGNTYANPITQIDQKVTTSGSCDEFPGYRPKTLMNNLTIVDNDINTASDTKLATSDRELLRLGFELNGIKDAEAAVGDIQIIDKNLLVCTGGACPATTFSPLTGNIYVASKVGIGITNPGYLLDVNGTAEMNTLSIGGTAVTATSAELNILDGVTGLTAAELTSLGAVTATSTELNYVDGVTSAIQTQLGLKAPLASPTFTGTVTAPTFSGNLSGNATYASTAGAAYPYRVGGVVMQFNWSGQAGQPAWLWGGSDGTNMYVYNPSNFSVNYAASAGTATNLSGGTASASTYTLAPTSYGSFQLAVGNADGGSLAGATADFKTWYGFGMIAVAGNAWGNGTRTIAFDVRNGAISTRGNVSVGGSVTASSDQRLKTNIRPLPDNILEKVNKLQGIYFNWKPETHNGKATQIGVIAQEVEKLFPEIVVTGTDGYKSVDYSRFSPILIEAVKEQQAEIDSLKQQVSDLNQRLIQLENKLK